ncbi:MAG: hypothetical protein HDS35_07810 [Bacteroides sp.]|nr:hypothetical protein [Bacteroides sp.]
MTHILMWMSLSEDMTDMAGEYNIRMDNEERAGEWENRGGGEERAGAIAGFRNVGTAARFQYR